ASPRRTAYSCRGSRLSRHAAFTRTVFGGCAETRISRRQTGATCTYGRGRYCALDKRDRKGEQGGENPVRKIAMSKKSSASRRKRLWRRCQCWRWTRSGGER